MAPRHTLNDVLLAERHRIDSILTSSAGLARPIMARKLAIQRGMGVEEAVELLQSMPSEESPYLRALSQESIGLAPAAGGDPLASSDPQEARKAEIKANVGAYNRSRGYRR